MHACEFCKSFVDLLCESTSAADGRIDAFHGGIVALRGLDGCGSKREDRALVLLVVNVVGQLPNQARETTVLANPRDSR